MTSRFRPRTRRSEPPLTEPCEKCGVVYAIGDWPFCPHGRGSGVVVGDEMDQVIENNGTPHAIRFRSRAALKAHMDAHGLTPKVRHVPLHQGTDYSPHTTDWSKGIDAYTLESARVLLSRPNARQPLTVEHDARNGFPIEHSIRVLDTGIKGTYVDE